MPYPGRCRSTFERLRNMKTYEVRAFGFDDSADTTDSRVFWVKAQSIDEVSQAIAGTNAKSVITIDDYDCIDFHLPAQAQLLKAKLLEFEVDHRKVNAKRDCTLVEPKQLVNGQVIRGMNKPVSRTKAAQYLKSCRNGQASVLRLNAGCYTILPDGLQHGFKLLTK